MRRRVRTDYKKRGITCDSRWDNYDAFLSDMGECPEGLTLERRDNDKGYSKDNCLWADYTAQLNNTSRNVLIEHDGEALTVAQ